GFAAMPLDRLLQAGGLSIMEEGLGVAQIEQRLRAEVLGGRYAEADVGELRPHVVEQQVGVRGEFAARQRPDGARSGAELGDVAGGAADLREQVAPAAPVLAELRGGRRAQEAHEVVREVDRVLGDLGIGDGIDARWNRLAADAFLCRLLRIGHAYFRGKGAGIELPEGGAQGLAAEPADPAVQRASRTSADAVMVSVVGVGVGQDLGIGNEIEQAAAEHDGRGAMRAGGRRRRDRLAVDAERLLQGGGGVQLRHRSTFFDQRVAGRGVEGGGVELDFVAAPARHRILVALAAPGRIEERPESGRGGERAVEDGLAAGEAVALLPGEAGHGVARLHHLGATSEQQEGGNRDPLWGHGFGTSILSTRSATRPVAVRWHSTRTTSPALNSRPARRAAVPPPACAAGARVTCTIRRAIPTPVIRSSAPVFAVNARTVPW